jgi:hypothetical protein
VLARLGGVATRRRELIAHPRNPHMVLFNSIPRISVQAARTCCCPPASSGHCLSYTGGASGGGARHGVERAVEEEEEDPPPAMAAAEEELSAVSCRCGKTYTSRPSSEASACLQPRPPTHTPRELRWC